MEVTKVVFLSENGRKTFKGTHGPKQAAFHILFCVHSYFCCCHWMFKWQCFTKFSFGLINGTTQKCGNFIVHMISACDL